MSLVDEYRRQAGWRAWSQAFAMLPSLHGQVVLDLGCGVGDLAAELVARGARVLGVDGNEELLAAARARGLPGAEFVQADLGALPDLGVAADGLWCSFAAAYFPDLPAVLGAWSRHLRPGVWAALTEIDDLFGHEPLLGRTRELLAGYARDALAAGRYDFHMGGKVRRHMERAGFTVERESALPDQEFSFAGPARRDVLDAWRARLTRMQGLHGYCGQEYAALRDDFLGCLVRADHRSLARVVFCLARR